MTETEHVEISRRLALAIGWPASSLIDGHSKLRAMDKEGWVRYFDYRDPAVIWPIAEKFDAFPAQIGNDGDWEAYSSATDTDARADTAALAVALAVIKAKESK